MIPRRCRRPWPCCRPLTEAAPLESPTASTTPSRPRETDERLGPLTTSASALPVVLLPALAGQRGVSRPRHGEPSGRRRLGRDRLRRAVAIPARRDRFGGREARRDGRPAGPRGAPVAEPLHLEQRHPAVQRLP